MNTSVVNIDELLKNTDSRIFEGGFGFEKENVRVTLDGKLAQTPHPMVLGNKQKHPFITTDFSESQIEMITPVRRSIDEALGFLETLHDEVSLHLDNELLWPQSSPPELPINESDIPLAKFDDKGADMEAYREYLALQYGRKKQMLSGVHFNISFNEKYLKTLYQQSEELSFSYEQFREQVYLKTLRNFKRYRWFLIALLSNSPVVHKSYIDKCVKKLPKFNEDAYHLSGAVSMRNSMCGYRNKQNLRLNYNTLQDYLSSIQKEIEQGIVKNEKENYASIRIKSSPQKRDLAYLEIRLLDLNPFEKIGINRLHIQIIHQFLIYCLLKPELNTFDEKIQERAFSNHEQAASFSMLPSAFVIDDNGLQVPFKEALEQKLSEIIKYTEGIIPEEYKDGANLMGALVYHPTERPAYRMVKQLKETLFIDWNLKQAKEYLKKSKLKTFQFYSMEDMELSTQLLMRAAIFKGVNVEVMDRKENFIRLFTADKTEYVMQATRTSLDNYASVLLMENKVMTKRLLERSAIRVPKGKEYTEKLNAQDDFKIFKKQPIVIKPKSTNFGKGITILKENESIKMYDQAIEMAFSYDDTILIEHFEMGKEYRFFVLNNKVEAVLQRVPANVVGDGALTITELVKEKNKSELRGKGYVTPLEKIKLGEPESMFLATQDMDFDTIPDEGQVVYLRENSNISTGGDSLDFTDDVHPSYKEIAVKAAEALNVYVTGLDMMIQDIATPANEENYAIIEMNFNPAIHIHCHPYQGKNRQLHVKMIDALGF